MKTVSQKNPKQSLITTLKIFLKKFKENIKRVDFDPEITRILHFRYK